PNGSHRNMGSFEFVTAVPSGDLKSVRVSSNSFFPYGVNVGTFLGGIPEGGNCFAKVLCVVSTILPRDSKSPMSSGLVFQTPDRSCGLNSLPGGLTSRFCCSGVRQCGHVFQPEGASSVWASADDGSASATARTSLEVMIRHCIFLLLCHKAAGH